MKLKGKYVSGGIVQGNVLAMIGRAERTPETLYPLKDLALVLSERGKQPTIYEDRGEGKKFKVFWSIDPCPVFYVCRQN